VNPAQQIKRAAVRATRSALIRYARGRPDPAEEAGAERRVFVILMTAFGMGGTIRTTMNLVNHLAGVGYEVIILSVGQARDTPFFGDLPPTASIVTMDDKRPEMEPGRLQPIRRALRKRSSVLMHPVDQSFKGFNLWVDWQLVKALRGRTGFLITTRPGLNLLAAELAPQGLVLIGQEHMHLREHDEVLQRAMKRRYRKLAALSVLTERDRKRYARHLGKRTSVVRIPNTVRDMGGVSADLSAKTVLAAGRLARQKGYDRLIKTWALVAPEHPDWRLRIYGNGPAQARLERMIATNRLEESVTLAGPAKDLGAEMAKASIFVLSSRWEGLPLALLEAMSVGMAVVSFDCPTGPADVVDDHRNGLLIRPRTIAALAAGLNEMIEDEELRRTCAAGALETVHEYSMEVVGPQWEAVLREAWAARTPSSASSSSQREPITSIE
jgi:glycosyltransferase involved in cell wall biosynthesis